jgi:ribosome-associated heat shock protein Hsp15
MIRRKPAPDLIQGGTRLSEKIMLQRDDIPTTTHNRQRIDRWLWHARLVRTRSAAAALAAAGYVRVNGTRIDAPGRLVRIGDVITVALDRAVKVLKVTGFAERRGAAAAGHDLYDELR